MARISHHQVVSNSATGKRAIQISCRGPAEDRDALVLQFEHFLDVKNRLRRCGWSPPQAVADAQLAIRMLRQGDRYPVGVVIESPDMESLHDCEADS